MKTIQNTVALLILLVTLTLSGCSKTETSESLKAKYGVAPLGIEACDTYLNKLRNCVDKAPAKDRSSIVDIYTFIISDMKQLIEDNSPESQKMAIKACNMGESANEAPMKAMGCDW